MSNYCQRAWRSRGQSTVEFALILPLAVLCVGMLVAVLSASLQTLRLHDCARVIARTAATSSDVTEITKDGKSLCKCDVQISEEVDIVTVRASRTLTVLLIGLPLAPIRISAESFAMREPVVVFEPPQTP